MKGLIQKFIPPFLVNWYHFLLAFLGAILYWFPSQNLKVIGITGTNGKTTTVEIVSKILEEASHKVALMNSIRFKIGEKEWPNILKMTMPGRFKIQKFLREAVNSGCQYAVLEVTSEGIKQHRHRFIDFEVAVLTNLAPEHIEAHGGFESYRAAKGKLFQATKGIHIINLDDENAEYFLKIPCQKKWGYSIDARYHGDRRINAYKLEEVIEAKSHQLFPYGLKFSINDTSFNLKLIGKFNISNSLAAICVGLSQGISLEICKKALEKLEGIPGRMEEVISQPFKVFVDYAFTPNALEKVYQTLTHQLINSSTNKLICVLGAAGGGRDKWKRPVLGKIAGKYCDKVIITNEDPYNEDPMEIIEQVAEGAGDKAKKILERGEAIREALKLSQPGDVLIITGKGCEPWICVAGGKKIPWDDRQVVREEFNNLQHTTNNLQPNEKI